MAAPAHIAEAVTGASAPVPAAEAAAQAPAWPDDAVEVGWVLGAWGIKGAIKVSPIAADPQALSSTGWWFLKPVDGPASKAAARRLPPALQVRGVREQGDVLVAQAEGIADRDAAEALKGARVFISRARFPAPEPGEFYWVDLIGLAVVNRDGVALGEVVGLIDTGPHCVLRVRAPALGATDAPAAVAEADERLIPFVEAYVDSVDLAGRQVVVDWGLDY